MVEPTIAAVFSSTWVVFSFLMYHELRAVRRAVIDNAFGTPVADPPLLYSAFTRYIVFRKIWFGVAVALAPLLWVAFVVMVLAMLLYLLALKILAGILNGSDALLRRLGRTDH